AGKPFEQRLREEYGRHAAGKRGDRGPRNGYAIATGATAKQAGHALEVVIRAIGVGQETHREKQQRSQHGELVASTWGGRHARLFLIACSCPPPWPCAILPS